MNLSRPWLALVIALFCLPLFIGLGHGDVQDDEAIYSFGVDRILEMGDWLAPKSSPHEDAAFLEKPPLKFWIVAAPIRLGLLPHNEFGLRFWDALFGGAAFLYVFAIGSMLAGPVSGAVAVLILFVHRPLLFEHGLRTNNMEGALFLCYCGGFYHYLKWGSSDAAAARRWHAVAMGLYFVLGFMTKFVAAIFLALVAGVASLVVPRYRARLITDWRLWLQVTVLVLALCTPWFVYATLRFGSDFWHIILGEHVVTRFTKYLNPEHVQPWYYYPTQLYLRLRDSGAELIVIGGLAALSVMTVLRRWAEGQVVLLWAVLPMALLSLTTSKLYHYAYPYLPPLAIAGGYAAGLAYALGPVPVARALGALDHVLAARVPRVVAVCRRPALRTALLVLAAAAVTVAIVTIVYGPVRLQIGGTDIFKSSGLLRPSMVAIVVGVLAGAGRTASRAVVALVIANMLPLGAYRTTWSELGAEPRPKRAAIDCIDRVDQNGGPARGLYLDLPNKVIGHPLYYYFRRIRPWTRTDVPAPEDLLRYLNDPSSWRPILIWGETYQSYRRLDPAWADRASPPMATFGDDVLLLLPGPYGACSDPKGHGSR